MPAGRGWAPWGGRRVVRGGGGAISTCDGARRESPPAPRNRRPAAAPSPCCPPAPFRSPPQTAPQLSLCPAQLPPHIARPRARTGAVAADDDREQAAKADVEAGHRPHDEYLGPRQLRLGGAAVNDAPKHGRRRHDAGNKAGGGRGRGSRSSCGRERGQRGAVVDRQAAARHRRGRAEARDGGARRRVGVRRRRGLRHRAYLEPERATAAAMAVHKAQGLGSPLPGRGAEERRRGAHFFDRVVPCAVVLTRSHRTRGGRLFLRL